MNAVETFRAHTKRSGQATLSFILLVSGIIIEIAIAGIFVTMSTMSSGVGERLAARAFAVAQSGIREAQMRVARNPNYSGNFDVTIGSDRAIVVVPAPATEGSSKVYAVTVRGSAGTRVRQFRATFVSDALTGLLNVQSVVEVPAGS